MAMPYRLLLVPLLAALLTGAMPARAAGPEGFCPPLFVPEGYRLKCEASPALEGGWQLTVRPDPPLQSPFTRLTIRPVEEPVDEPGFWLQERLTFNLVELGHALRDVLGRPESPLYEPLLSEPLGSLIPYLAALEQLPLQGCGYPEQLAGGEVWQMECEWELGSLRYHGFLRLVHLGGQPYVVSAFASDPRRLRHLEAIANGF